MLTLGDGGRARKEKARRRLLKCEIMFQLYTLRSLSVQMQGEECSDQEKSQACLVPKPQLSCLKESRRFYSVQKHWFAMAKRHADLRLSLALQTRYHIIQYRNIRIGNYGYVLLLLSYLYGVKEVKRGLITPHFLSDLIGL